MAHLKRVVALLAVFAMFLMALTGCNTTTAPAATAAPATEAPATEAPATEEPTPAPDPLAEKVNISFASWSIGDAAAGENDPVRDAIYQKLNITIEPINLTWDDYTQKIQIWAASDQLPDMFAIDAIGTANYKKWIEEGIVHALPTDLSAYPNLDKLMKGSGMEIYYYPMGAADAKVYGIPRLNHYDADGWAGDTAVHVRKDWIANVGATEPTTMDEFIDLMVKFANNDPDQDGQADTVGLTCYNASWLQWFMLNYEPGTNGWIKDASGKWMPAFMTPGTLEGIKGLKKLYDAGGLDKDIATLKGDEGRDKYASSVAGAYAHDATVSTCQFYVGAQFEKMNPDKKYTDVMTLLKPFKNADGNYYRLIATPGWSETYLNGKADDLKVDRICRLFDYLLSDEGYNLIHYGIEGTDWKMEGDKIVVIPTLDAENKPVVLSTKYPFVKLSGTTEWSGTHQFTTPAMDPIYQKIAKDNVDWLLANAKAQPINLMIPLLDVPSKDKATFNLSDLIIKCVLSDDAEATYNTEINNYKANGYDKLIEDVNAAAAAAGIK